MSDLTIIRIRIFAGFWEGIIRPSAKGRGRPAVSVTHLGAPLANVEIEQMPDSADWSLRIPIPADVIADGVHTFLITDPATDETLETFTLIAGEALDEDLRAEVDLLREELDMLKRAFRRHCLETT